MVNYRPSTKSQSKFGDDLAFVPKAVGGLAGVVLGWAIANFAGII